LLDQIRHDVLQIILQLVAELPGTAKIAIEIGKNRIETCLCAIKHEGVNRAFVGFDQLNPMCQGFHLRYLSETDRLRHPAVGPVIVLLGVTGLPQMAIVHWSAT